MATGARNVGAYGAAVAEVLKVTQVESGMSLRSVAPYVGISFTQVGRILNGEKPMTMDEFAGLCNALGVDPVEVMTEAEESVAGERPSLSLVDGSVDGERCRPDDGLPDVSKLAARRVASPPSWDASQAGGDAGEEPQG